MNNQGKTEVLRCWDLICSALGFDIPLTATFELASHDYIRLYLKNLDPHFPELCINLRPEAVCISGQVSLFLSGAGNLMLLISCDLSSQVLSAHIFDSTDVASGSLTPTNLRSRFPVSMSLYQIYDTIQRAVIDAFFINGGNWTPLVLK